MTTFLTKEELVELTGKKLHSSQEAALKCMGITHKKRPDGSVAVLRNHIEKDFGGLQENARMEKSWKPDWSKPSATPSQH